MSAGTSFATLGSPRIERILCAAVALAVLGAVVVRAWVGDDALITARSVDNLLHGYGWRWNIDERVQVFTNPLWAMLMAVPFALHVPWYAALLGLSFLVTSLTLALISYRGRSARAVFVGLCVLASSRAFVEFSTSGLETPLTALLVALLVFETPRFAASAADVTRMALLTALLAVNRLDAVVIATPALLWTLGRARPAVCWSRMLGSLLIGVTPLILWELFALIYYGFPFPNTAYAKLGGALGRGMYLHMGAASFIFTFVWDRFSLLVPIATFAIALRYRSSGAALALLAGVLLHYVYVLWAGGDFMAGRFFLEPLVLCATLLASDHVQLPAARERMGLLASALLLGNLVGHAPLPVALPRLEGIIDERSVWADELSLLAVLGHGAVEHRWLERGRNWERFARSHASRPGSIPVIRHARSVGMVGFAAGPQVHVVDHLALTDPMLARMPAGWVDYPHIGHLERMGQICTPLRQIVSCSQEHAVCRFWHDYETSLRTGTCSLHDADLCTYWNELQKVTRGKLFSRGRWKAIIALNLGWLDGLIDVDHYRDATREYPNGSCRE